MVKKKHIMSFTRQVARRKLALIPAILEKQGPMTKHQVAAEIGAVARTAQTYLVELERRDLVHVARLVKQVRGGTPVSLWGAGPKPYANYEPLVQGLEPKRKNRVKRDRSREGRLAYERRRIQMTTIKPRRDPWQVHFWGETGMAGKKP